MFLCLATVAAIPFSGIIPQTDLTIARISTQFGEEMPAYYLPIGFHTLKTLAKKPVTEQDIISIYWS